MYTENRERLTCVTFIAITISAPNGPHLCPSISPLPVFQTASILGGRCKVVGRIGVLIYLYPSVCITIYKYILDIALNPQGVDIRSTNNIRPPR